MRPVQYRDPLGSNDHPGTQTGPGGFTRSRTETYRYDGDDRLIEQIILERKTQRTLDAVGRRIKQLITALVAISTSATAPERPKAELPFPRPAPPPLPPPTAGTTHRIS